MATPPTTLSMGIDWQTGKIISGFDHVLQSLGIIWTTRIGQRVIREYFGNPGITLLGQIANEANIVRFWQVLVMVTNFWEPRFQITKVLVTKVTELGEILVTLEGEYRPRGHLGDPTPEAARRVQFVGTENAVRVQGI